MVSSVVLCSGYHTGRGGRERRDRRRGHSRIEHARSLRGEDRGKRGPQGRIADRPKRNLTR